MSFFTKKEQRLLLVDLHSHLIPGIDDGTQTISQSLNLIKTLESLGVKKIITTPHIHPRYPNTPELINEKSKVLIDTVSNSELNIMIEVAAEYYVDESFHESILKDDPILSFGDNYVLVEAPFQNKPMNFENVLFDLQSKGYKPVLAHPERYQFLEGSLEWLIELKKRNVLLQLTIGSIGGYYGSAPNKMGSMLLKQEMIDFVGSDLHHSKHLDAFKKGLKSKVIQKALSKEQVKNHELL
ncbi:tyrosine-protein phosphatase [Ekhidna sp.]|uniref:tyrosine-protein phosphatase n=1 Tax=Ekhidna sp. TaxID=2608089 RepID=UPI003B514F42